MDSLAINRLRRLFLEQLIEEAAIALLDQINGDTDFVDEREEFGRIVGGVGA